MNYQIVAALLLVSACFALALDFQSCAETVEGKTYSLEPVKGKDISFPDGSYTYWLAFCGKVSGNAICASQADNPNLCGVSGDYPQSYSTWTSTGGKIQWALQKPGDHSSGLLLTFPTSGSFTFTVNLNVNCKAGGATEFTAHGINWQWPNLMAYVDSPQGCPGSGGGGGASKGGLSGGWIFIIILLVVLVVYITAGCIWKYKKVGTVGMENCPNYYFWKAIPGYSVDGCKWTWKKLRACCGSKSGGDTYEDVPNSNKL
eukprot:TRINITY_DN420_c1_g2_i2.p1 TRINITY_DN420_c1_g2~~TRINITY_DN420_c1_g2_i2.p1  ORF type:complete len:259 (-),score=44.69 TRINITY_DN420_c1_g2_i2:691-1467(-)